MNRSDFAKRANERCQQGKQFLRAWRVGAIDDYAFIAGKQWLQADEAILTEQKRPPITFNYSEKMIDAVVGAEVAGRQETRYGPRGVEDSGVADLMTSAGKWVREQGNAEDEESDAFRDMLICGLGWTYTHLSYDDDMDGGIPIDRIDPLEMYYDPAASKVGLTDRRWHFREFWAYKLDVRAKWPKASLDGTSSEENLSTGVVRHGQGYNDADDLDQEDRHKEQVLLRHYECCDFEYVYRVQGPDGGIQELTEAEFKPLKQTILDAGLPFVRQRKKVYYHAYFIGDTMLQMDKSPCQGGFMYNPITGKRDRNTNFWYGLTRVMKDPQRWANKWLSQILHIINTNAKGGLMAEINAFVDIEKAKEEWAHPDTITLFTEGALSGNKVVQKQQAPYPSGLDKLMEFALGSLPMVTGINLEALGLANREQAGVLERQRKEAAYGLLAPMFDALRRYRKAQGRSLLYFINEYLSDGRLVRIGGPESEQFAPLAKVPGAMRYDIIVDQSPNAPDVKQKTWESLNVILPAMMKANYPIPPDVLDYTPLPASLAAKWKAFVGQQQQADQELQEENAKLKEENQKLQQGTQVKEAELMLKKHEKEQELQMREHEMRFEFEMRRWEMQSEIALEREKAVAQFELEKLKARQQLELNRITTAHDMQMEEKRVENDAKLAQQQAKQKESANQTE